MSVSERTRNSEVLESFVAYARAHPENRFWQNLRNWSGLSFITASRATGTDSVWETLDDTFYWEKKDG
jgi:hypothetical protein